MRDLFLVCNVYEQVCAYTENDAMLLQIVQNVSRNLTRFTIYSTYIISNLHKNDSRI